MCSPIFKHGESLTRACLCKQEYGAHIISTVPTVPYIYEYSDGSKLEVQNPAALPSNPKQRVVACWEPTVIATIVMPSMLDLLSPFSLSVGGNSWSTRSLTVNGFS